MTNQPKRSRWKRRALIAFVLPVAYVFSMGPIIWLQNSGYIYAPETVRFTASWFFARIAWLRRWFVLRDCH